MSLRDQIKVFAARTLLCNLPASILTLSGRNGLKAAQSGFDGRYWLVCVPCKVANYRASLEDMALCPHIQACFSSSLEVEREERQANYTEWFFYLGSSNNRSFLFFLFQSAVGNVVPWAVWFFSASKYRLFLLGITVCFGVQSTGRAVLLPPCNRLFYSYIPLFFSVGCDSFISEGLTTAIILLIQKTDPS